MPNDMAVDGRKDGESGPPVVPVAMRTKTCPKCQEPFQVVARGFNQGRTATYCEKCNPRRVRAVKKTVNEAIEHVCGVEVVPPADLHPPLQQPDPAPPAPPPVRASDLARAASGRRRYIDPTTCEREYTEDDVAFMKAMERYKRVSRRPFPTWSEVLEVLVSLGYRKVEPAGPLPGAK